jgi:hypothetical protein
MANISKITRIPIREEFPNEAHNFTPWLKENLHYIGEKLHLSFTGEVETEVEVGKYRCDVLAHTIDGRRVVIENQFGHADHDHFGKILTYAAGLEADVVIWIAEDFWEPHITAINWLNSKTSEETLSFFAIKVGLIKIEDSKSALEVTIVKQPDEWGRQVKTERITRERSERSIKYHEFWQHFVTYFEKLKNKNPSHGHYVNIPSEIPKFNFTFMFTHGKFPAIQLYLQGDTNDKIFEKLKSHQVELESVLPNLEWGFIGGKSVKVIRITREKEYVFSDKDREEVMEWFSKTMQKFENAFNPLLQNI